MRDRTDRTTMGQGVRLFLFLAALATLTGIAALSAAAGAAAPSVPNFTLRQDIVSPLVKAAFGELRPAPSGTGQGVQVTDLSNEVYMLDLPSMGVHPLQSAPPKSRFPDGGAV